MKKKLYKTFAAIHLGSEMISMQIVEYRNLNNIKIIDECNRRVRLGEETFKNKIIPFSMVSEICELLAGYKRLMKEYGVDEYRIEATTAVREALNRAFLVDQIYIKTGLKVAVVGLPEEIYTKYVSIRRTLKVNGITGTDDGMLMMDISSGGLGITYIKDGNIKYQQNLHIGVIRIKESFNQNQRASMKFNQALSEFLSSTMGPVQDALKGEKIKHLVLSGTETELLLRMMNLKMNDQVIRINTEKFTELFYKVHELNLPQIIKIFKIAEHEAELVLPTILLYEQLLALAPAEEIVLTEDRFIDGITLMHIGPKTDEAYAEELMEEQLSLFRSVGARYMYNEAHSAQVQKLALAMFDKLGKHHGMKGHERLLLQATALLHDIGKYACLRGHSKYSYKMIMSTDFIGFGERDKEIVALASYYQANKLVERNPDAPPIPEELVPQVAKLAALVRLADAMDRSYKQKIKTCRVSVKANTMTVEVVSKVDLTLEEWTFAAKAAFFEEVYGLKARLERVEK